MKLLLVGNHTCGNRGDAAILRGIVHYIGKQFPQHSIDLVSRYPTSSEYLLNEPFQIDTLFSYHQNYTSHMDRIWKSFSRIVVPLLLEFTLIFKYQFYLPKHVKEYIQSLKEYDAVIHVGGSFFVDLYGTVQFEHSLCALIANKPLYMLGHSVGPFHRSQFNRIARKVFSRVKMLGLRESISLDLLKDAHIDVSKVFLGADTAWLVNTNELAQVDNIQALISQRPTIAMTMRELAPFDKRLGVTQEEYEVAFAKLADQFIELGHQVLVFSTCTGIDSYHKDDRMVALRVARKVKVSEYFHVVMDELNDVELGSLLRSCQLTIGTRLHSAIISMNFGTEAIALNYEHKSAGIMQQLGMQDNALEVTSLFDGRLFSRSIKCLDEKQHSALEIKNKVLEEKSKAGNMVLTAINDAEGR
ncbi:colanic acid biosynthesis pyruvyl transferase WcaK [Paraglaciecola hydrolytica]|uniref:Polysaccharide pyruvyl transferase domain-containing protein n=1 Tax=Paraglaciecola hydrolytica TaxID=1799789 RepID=A0A135ZZJ0_9ALTE|nr:colanic acid biosynthesis pyruvyl transferase WcaK [Paraglaciecola hydrolytica]KXI28396.1 hypothetical protein AX660_17395 [Paraglaciecola hydrolytica]